MVESLNYLNIMSVKKVVLLILIGCSSFTLLSQVHVGIQGSYLYGFNKTNLGHLGGGVCAEFSLSKEIALRAGFNYFHMAEYQTTLDAIAFSPLTTPSKIIFDVKNELTLNQFYIGVKRYVVGQHFTFKQKSPIGVYFTADFGVLVGGMKAKTTDNIADATLYSIPISNNALNAFTDVNLLGGVGVDKLLGPIYLYYNLVAGAKIVSASNTGGAAKVPFFITSNFGFRKIFGDY